MDTVTLVNISGAVMLALSVVIAVTAASLLPTESQLKKFKKTLEGSRKYTGNAHVRITKLKEEIRKIVGEVEAVSFSIDGPLPITKIPSIRELAQDVANLRQEQKRKLSRIEQSFSNISPLLSERNELTQRLEHVLLRRVDLNEGATNSVTKLLEAHQNEILSLRGTVDNLSAALAELTASQESAKQKARPAAKTPKKLVKRVTKPARASRK